ncbi:Hypothetical protein ACGLYG10_0938 [Actinomyces glycerinitolerans]|uniref:Uncharacterized protein n=1 Tax=Actinomyces glycerinitolerans TaxID=1892869 RepID=A0A1M4RXS5_9ACTO|nr:Hypothetical protein ACGLYG10_0938 [Actinomyces glycerinitolerans]
MKLQVTAEASLARELRLCRYGDRPLRRSCGTGRPGRDDRQPQSSGSFAKSVVVREYRIYI